VRRGVLFTIPCTRFSIPPNLLTTGMFFTYFFTMNDPYIPYDDGNGYQYPITIPSLSPSPGFAQLEVELLRVSSWNPDDTLQDQEHHPRSHHHQQSMSGLPSFGLARWVSIQPLHFPRTRIPPITTDHTLLLPFQGQLQSSRWDQVPRQCLPSAVRQRPCLGGRGKE